MQLIRPIQTRFPYGSGAQHLNLAAQRNSPARSTKSTRSHFNVLPLLVGIGFQVLFHSPPGVLFTFPSRYYTLSVTRWYLALGGGPPDFPRDSSCPVVLWIPASLSAFSFTGLLPSSAPLSRGVQLTHPLITPVRNPVCPKTHGLGSFLFARRY